MKFYRSIFGRVNPKKRSIEGKEPQLGNPFSYSDYLMQDLEKSKNLLDQLKKQDIDSNPDNQITRNLMQLRSTLNQPKDNNFNEQFEVIMDKCGTEESCETLRQERWDPDIFCPNCRATDINKLPLHLQVSPYIYKYECKSCLNKFNDDSELPIEQGAITVNMWMQCWYLLGCTTSIEKIAEKLNLDLHAVEEMIADLQKAFKIKQPGFKDANNSSWAQQKAIFQKKIDAIISEKSNELYGGNIVRQAQDTNEERKQRTKKSIAFKNKNN